VLLIAVCFLGQVCARAHARATNPDPVLQTIVGLLETPDADLDLAKAKVTVDHLVDPTVDVNGTLRQLDALAAAVRVRVPPGASNRTKLDTLLSTLYKPGPWNDNRPFNYDFTDPFGKNIHNKLISTYLTTRKGNCVSMPLLFAILGQKLGLRVTVATAPAHLLVKYASDEGEWLNVEATGGGFKYDTSYERDTGISPKAIENQIYLRPLSQRESVAVVLSELMEYYGQQDQQARRVAVADMALKVNPKDVVAILQKADGDYILIEERYKRRYATPAQIPVDQRQDYARLSRENLELFARAEALGWTAPTEAQEDHYLDTIRQAKAAQKETK